MSRTENEADYKAYKIGMRLIEKLSFQTFVTVLLQVHCESHSIQEHNIKYIE